MRTHNSPTSRVPVAAFLAGCGVGNLLAVGIPDGMALLSGCLLVIGGILLALVVDHQEP